MSRQRTTWMSWGLVLFGFGLSLYLLLRTLALAGGTAGDFSVCSALFGGGCDEALGSGGGTLLGIPWAGWGMVLYGTVATFLGLDAWLGSAFSREARLAAFGVAAGGGLVGLWLSATMLLGGGPLCALCLGVHATTLLLAGALWLHRQQPCVDSGAEPPWKAVGLLCGLLVAALLYQWVLVEHRLGQARTAVEPSRAVARWEARTPVALPIRSDDPRLGSSLAPVQVVVFASLQCPGCEELSEFLKEVMRRTGEDVSVVFKHYPLGEDCNPEAGGDLHPHACAAALAAEAARRQGKFWDFHDAVHRDGLEDGEKALVRVAMSIKLDMERFAADRRDPALGARIREDVALGNQLEVTGTPALFVNGRPIHTLETDVIDAVVDHACEMDAD